MAMIVTTAIATAKKVHEAPTNATDAMDATDVEVATISRTANATQAAENAANAAMAMIARRIRPKWRDAVPSEGDTSRDGSDGPARQVSKEEATSVAPPCARGTRQRHRER
jgi:hypothetical protein